MSEVITAGTPVGRRASLVRLRLWHLMLLVGYVAIAIVDIQDQRQNDPVMVGLACAGFAGYALLGWLGWLAAQRLEGRLRATPLLVLYLVAMGGLFFVVTVVYLVVEHFYLVS